jgi:hypothetical protein
MPESVKYKCSRCGEEHEEWPALSYISPTSYDTLSDNDKKELGDLESDFCVINHVGRTDRFIRCTLTQKVIDYCENLEFGLWVSLSEKSFQDYADNYNNENHETIYFGWLSNNLPDYNFDKSIPTNVITKTGNQRPEVIPHKDFDHPFVYDYFNGITKAKAEQRIKNMLLTIEGNA